MRQIILWILLLLWISGAQAQSYGEKSIEQLKEDLAKIDKSIEVTRKKMKEIRDVTFLPELYFVLAELYVDKSRYTYTLSRSLHKEAPLDEVDFSESLKAKRQAIEIYQRFIETFPKNENLDKAYFFMAHEYRETGNNESMAQTYLKLLKEFPKSPFWEETQLILGDYFLDNKKEPKMAADFYEKILERPQNPFMPIARYKLGWCQINLEKFHEALLSFEGVVTIDAKIPLDKLPDVYKKSDVKRDALIAMVWPYSEEKKYEPFRANALEYFESLAPNRPTLLKVLNKLTKRLMLKNNIEMAMPVYYRLLDITNDLESRVEVIDKFYEALKKSTNKNWPLDSLSTEISETLIKARFSPLFSAQEKVKIEKNFEIYLRDIVTKLHDKAKRTNATQDYQVAIQGYEDYLLVCPNNKYSVAMLQNLAESYFAIKNYPRAGYKYEELSKRIKKSSVKGVYDSSIQSFALALKNPEKISKLELTESREGFRDIGTLFIKSYPGDKANAMIMFNIGRTYYDERDFDRAVASFVSFINAYPDHKETTTAGNLVLDSYNQREDYEGLIKAGKDLIGNTHIKNKQFKADISEIIKQAEYRKIQNSTGDPRSRGYAQKLLQFANKYQGSSLGDQALYEAFTSLKAKKDFQAYEPGEQLLTKHGDSRYAKEVVGSMGQMALNTADYRRAAKYFELFARKYPKDPTSAGLLKNAANMRELMGDYKEAAEDYRDLRQTENIAKQYVLAQDWSLVSQTLSARNSGSLKSQYWLGLSLYRQGHVNQAKSYLSRSAANSASTYEDKSMAAHSLYLIASQALKEYQNIQLGGSNEAALVKKKAAALAQLESQFSRVIKYGNGRWTIASLYELGRANNEFAGFISKASVPPGLNPAQQAQYKGLVDQQSRQYKQKAQSFFEACLKNAEKSEVFTGFVKGCQTQGEQSVDEAIEEKISARAGESSPPNSTEIRRKLFDSPRNIELLMALAEAYLQSQDYAMSRLILSRVLEIKPGYAYAEAQMGMTMLFMNDLEGAQTSFKTALKHNPKEANALYGLAGLYKQFGFNSKYQPIAHRARGLRPVGYVHPWAKN